MPLILSFVLSRKTTHLVQHIFGENAVARGGFVDEHMRYRSDELAVLDDGGARHECGQVGTTILYSFQIDIEGVQEKKVKIFMPFCV